MCKSMQKVTQMSQTVSPAPRRVDVTPAAVVALTRPRSRSRSALAWAGQASRRAVLGDVCSLCRGIDCQVR
jgi:hypothetical protein